MITESELRVMAGFFPRGGSVTIKDIEKASGYSYERVYSTLKDLQRKGVVEGIKVGKTWSFKLDYNRDECLLSFVYYGVNKKEKFKKTHRKVSKLLDEYLSKIDARCAVVFGSYAKGDAKRGSDIDLLLVTADEDFEKKALALRHKYNLRLNPVKVSSIKSIKEENKIFFKEIRDFGVVIKGFEYFFEQVYR
ncbi:nucleotidyltransferase domain-containing protein [Candidatus Pyrohabitans sp.]